MRLCTGGSPDKFSASRDQSISCSRRAPIAEQGQESHDCRRPENWALRLRTLAAAWPRPPPEKRAPQRARTSCSLRSNGEEAAVSAHVALPPRRGTYQSKEPPPKHPWSETGVLPSTLRASHMRPALRMHPVCEGTIRAKGNGALVTPTLSCMEGRSGRTGCASGAHVTLTPAKTLNGGAPTKTAYAVHLCTSSADRVQSRGIQPLLHRKLHLGGFPICFARRASWEGANHTQPMTLRSRMLDQKRKGAGRQRGAKYALPGNHAPSIARTARGRLPLEQ